jgi:hypothetical protein
MDEHALPLPGLSPVLNEDIVARFDGGALRRDPVFEMALERLPGGAGLCSQPTLSRLENLPDIRALIRMGRTMVAAYCASFRHAEALPVAPDPGRYPASATDQGRRPAKGGATALAPGPAPVEPMFRARPSPARHE